MPGLVRKRRLSEDVADHLEKMIRDGEFAEEGRLPSERDLMRHFGVGRPSVREALQHLSKMGLVEVASGERARVTSPTPQFVLDTLAGPARHLMEAPDGLRHFQNARVFFEAGLARHAASHASAEDLAALAAALDANRESIGDLDRFEQTDVDFHYVLAVIARNPIFTALHAAIAGWLHDLRRRTLVPGEDAKAFEAHRAIHAAIAGRDPDAAEQAMRDHLGYISRRYAHVVGGAP